MKIAVTGATGHVGINLVKRLVDQGHYLKVLVYEKIDVLDGLDVEIVKGSLQNIESLKQLCEGAEVVFHFAALISIGSDSDKKIFDINVLGTQNIVNSAMNVGVKKLIHFSSIHALVHKPYNHPMDESREIATDSPISYERTKAIADKWVMEQHNDNLEIVVLNPTAIIGPNDTKPSFMGEFMKLIYAGNLPGLVPGGYDWVDVRDVAEAAITAIEKGRGGERYILSGKWLSIKNFADIFVEYSDKNKYLSVLPLWLARLGVPFMWIFSKLTGKTPVYTYGSLEILKSNNRFISSDKAQLELGFKPRPLKETIFDTYSWYKENNYL